jgi:RNA polymerase sigma-70 factor (ECF subfamily)
VNDSTPPNRQTGVIAAALADVSPSVSESASELQARQFRRLLDATLDAAYGRAAVILGDRFEAEDAVHDAAEKAWRHWRELRSEDRFEAWFGRILVNTCRDRLRRRRRLRLIEVAADLADDAPARPPAALDAVDARDRLRRGLSVLSADERIAIVLRYEADLTVPAIAALTGAPEGTIKSRLHHALRRLRDAMGGLEP